MVVADAECRMQDGAGEGVGWGGKMLACVRLGDRPFLWNGNGGMDKCNPRKGGGDDAAIPAN